MPAHDDTARGRRQARLIHRPEGPPSCRTSPSPPASTTARPAATDQGPLVAGGARAALAAPVVAVFAIVVGAPIYADDMSEAAATGRFTLAAAATLAVFVLLAFALVAIYAAQEHAARAGPRTPASASR